MNPFEVSEALNHLTLLVDTREQDTLSFRRRMKEAGIPWERRKLDFGDYSMKAKLEDGQEVDFSPDIAIERQKEFSRAKEAGAKLYLLVENGSWEKAFGGDYRSQMKPQALTASLTAWLARYNCQVIFCQAKTTPRLIREIVYREAKERLEGM